MGSNTEAGQPPLTDPSAQMKAATPASQLSPQKLKSTRVDLGHSNFYCEPPYKYTNKDIDSSRKLQQPPQEWLNRTWTVTHSTLDMWRSARNVRITYTTLPSEEGKPAKIDDLVEYEPMSSSTPKRKTVRGVDTRSESGWEWRGKSWLFFVTSHWEILSWGEVLSQDGTEVVERWVVTWFAPTLFTKEGVDIYSDREEGVSEETYKRIYEGLEGMVRGQEQESTSNGEQLLLDPEVDVVRMWRDDLLPVEIKLPWLKE